MSSKYTSTLCIHTFTVCILFNLVHMFILICFFGILIFPIKLSKLCKIIKQELFRFQWSNKILLLRNMNRVLFLLETPFLTLNINTAQLSWQQKYLNTWFVTDENEIYQYASVLTDHPVSAKSEVFLWLALKTLTFVVRVATKFQKPKHFPNKTIIVMRVKVNVATRPVVFNLSSCNWEH